MPVGSKLNIDPEIVEKLRSGNGKLWSAAHDDGSGNRINADAVLEASTLGVDAGLLEAGMQWIRKMFRNRGKTKEDFAAEKEAAKINRTAGALEEMLLEYFQAAQEGSVDGEALRELIDTLEEMHGYCQSGKLQVPGKTELAKMRGSIVEYTSAIAESRNVQLKREPAAAGADEFQLIKEQLLRQAELLDVADPD